MTMSLCHSHRLSEPPATAMLTASSCCASCFSSNRFAKLIAASLKFQDGVVEQFENVIFCLGLQECAAGCVGRTVTRLQRSVEDAMDILVRDACRSANFK